MRAIESVSDMFVPMRAHAYTGCVEGSKGEVGQQKCARYFGDGKTKAVGAAVHKEAVKR